MTASVVERRDAEVRRHNRVLVTKLGVIVIAMFGFGWVGAIALRPHAGEWNESGWGRQPRSAP